VKFEKTFKNNSQQNFARYARRIFIIDFFVYPPPYYNYYIQDKGSAVFTAHSLLHDFCVLYSTTLAPSFVNPVLFIPRIFRRRLHAESVVRNFWDGTDKGRGKSEIAHGAEIRWEKERF
jgi:hypothetical protein